jgi:hypothetical protein
MQERRGETFTFKSERALINFFSPMVPKPQLQAIIETARTQFSPRSSNTPLQNRLEFLKKCEGAILRTLRVQEPGQ